MPLLFSYGTLQDEAVQRSEFGRILDGSPDELVGYRLGTVTVLDPDFVGEGGAEVHAIVRPTGRETDRVSGTAYEITDDELARADAYEPLEYERVSAVLASGRSAWVYAEALQ
ncbi:MAG: gamma-glutamylcyclotransferase [Gemmatimonadota bacterium]|nr:gamma-glutamylcyclotransferase [Gemmatimonadota bacterium]